MAHLFHFNLLRLLVLLRGLRGNQLEGPRREELPAGQCYWWVFHGREVKVLEFNIVSFCRPHPTDTPGPVHLQRLLYFELCQGQENVQDWIGHVASGRGLA